MRRYGAGPVPDLVFESLALQLFSYQFGHNTAYQRFCLLQGKEPGKVLSWKDIPAVPAMAFKELPLRSFPASKTRRVFRTSGTTLDKKGEHSFDTLRLYEAAILAPFETYLLPEDPRLHYYFLMESARSAPHSSLSFMMEVVERTYAPKAGYYVQDGQPLYDKLAWDLRRQTQKVFLLSTAFALKGFLDHLEVQKLRLQLAPGSRLMETGGFKGRVQNISKKRLYALCEKWLGLPATHCVSEYGMTELSSQSYDTTLHDHVKGLRRRPFKMGPSWFRTLVIDPATGREAKKGRTGLLRHVDLANRGSVIAVQTEDIGRVVGEGFEVMGRAPGAELRGCSLSHEQWLRVTA